MLLIFAFGITLGCRTETEPLQSESGKVAEHVLGFGGHFRGHKLGAPIDSVLLNDRDFLFRRTFGELFYSIPFSPSDSAYFDVTYAFSNKRLYEIQVDIFSGDDELSGELFEELSKRFSERHTIQAMREEYAFWTDQFRGREIEITLRNVSAEHHRPRLSLNIIEPQIFVH